jgi:hypothetical protein
MQSELHERARSLLDRSLVEGIPAEEQRWLDSHIAHCAECTDYAELSGRAVRALDSFAFELDPEAALRVQEAVRARADQMAGANFAVGIPVAFALTMAGSLAMWGIAAWLAARWNVPAPAWHTAFATLWLLPSVVLDMLLLFRVRLMGNVSDEGETI